MMKKRRIIRKPVQSAEWRKVGENRRIGHLRCLSRTGSGTWLCRCDCGRETEVSESLLRCGVVTSCGCVPSKSLNLSGRQFGRLRVLEPLPIRDRDGSVRWLCRCSCGEYTIVSSNKLLTGHTASCGCYQEEKMGSNRTFVAGTCLEIIASEKLHVNNTSGCTGVSMNRGKWMAYIAYAGKYFYLGKYGERDEAVSVRKEAERLRLDYARSMAEATDVSLTQTQEGFGRLVRRLLAQRRGDEEGKQVKIG